MKYMNPLNNKYNKKTAKYIAVFRNELYLLSI